MIVLFKLSLKFFKSKTNLPQTTIYKHDYLVSHEHLFKEKPKHFFDLKNYLINENKQKTGQKTRVKNLSKGDEKLNLLEKGLSKSKKKANLNAPEFVIIIIYGKNKASDF